MHERRIDRITDPAFVRDLDSLPLDELRERRDLCMAEREYQSLLRRLVQGRLEILQAERGGRERGEEGSVVDRLPEILAGDDDGGSRGEAVRVGLPDDELAHARRRVERLVADAGVSDPTELADPALDAAIERFAEEERALSASRQQVIAVLDRLLDELKRRYKDDPSLALA